MELQFPLDVPLFKDILFSIIGITFFISLIILLLIILRINKKKKNSNYSRMENKSIQLFVLLSFLIIILTASTFKQIQYYRDYTSDDRVIVNETVGGINQINRSSLFVRTYNGEYKLYGLSYLSKNYSEVCDTVEKEFTGNYCEIEYYRRSKYLIRITRLD